MKRILLVAGLTISSCLFTGISFAASVTGNLQVTATVGSVCTVSTTAVNFGTVTELAYSSGDVTVNCPANTPYNIALDAGQHYDQQTRKLAYGDPQVGFTVGPRYYLGQDSNFDVEWGDSDFSNTYPSPSMADSGNGSDQAHPVYGYLAYPADPGYPVGAVMSDNVSVTVYY